MSKLSVKEYEKQQMTYQNSQNEKQEQAEAETYQSKVNVNEITSAL